eukprot:scaffold100080_cov32-Attheya_sp.AAC.2
MNALTFAYPIKTKQILNWDEDEDDHDKIGEIAVGSTRVSFMEAYDQGVLDEIAVYGHSLRTSTRKRQSLLQNCIGSSSTNSEDFDDNGNDANVDDDAADTNLDLRKEDISDTLTACTISD